MLPRHTILRPGEVTPDPAHRIGRDLAERLWADHYQVVIGTHVDKGHIHNHIAINSVAFTDGRKYRSTPATYYYDVAAHRTSCAKYGLSVIEPTGRGRSMPNGKRRMKAKRPSGTGCARTSTRASHARQHFPSGLRICGRSATSLTLTASISQGN